MLHSLLLSAPQQGNQPGSFSKLSLLEEKVLGWCPARVVEGSVAVPVPGQIRHKGLWGSGCSFPRTVEAKAASLWSQDQADALILVIRCQSPPCPHPGTCNQQQGHYPWDQQLLKQNSSTVSPGLGKGQAFSLTGISIFEAMCHCPSSRPTSLPAASATHGPKICSIHQPVIYEVPRALVTPLPQPPPCDWMNEMLLVPPIPEAKQA